MNTSLRFVSLLALSFLIAVPMMAACRRDSALDISQIIDPALTTLQRVPKTNQYLVFFAVKSGRIGFVCGRTPAGCSTPDGITYKPALSTNVISAIPSAECRAIAITVSNPTLQAVAGFRIRFEDNGSPSRKTFQFIFNPGTLKFSFQQVPEPTDPTD